MQLQIKVINIITSSILLIFLLLASPILISLSDFIKYINFPHHVTFSIKYAFFISLIPLIIFFSSNTEIVVSNWDWITINTIKISSNFKFDYFCIIFLSVALFVTWSIIEYSSWYMHADPHLNRFIKYLLLFLITIIILTSANNLFQLFIGWEGVGIISFLLIGWWYGRTEDRKSVV